MAPLLALAIAALSALLQDFQVPDWIASGGPFIIYAFGLLFKTIESYKGEPMNNWEKRFLIMAGSVALAAYAVITGQAGALPALPTEPDPQLWGDAIMALALWFWGGATAIFVIITAAMAAGRKMLGLPPKTAPLA